LITTISDTRPPLRGLTVDAVRNNIDGIRRNMPFLKKMLFTAAFQSDNPDGIIGTYFTNKVLNNLPVKQKLTIESMLCNTFTPTGMTVSGTGKNQIPREATVRLCCRGLPESGINEILEDLMILLSVEYATECTERRNTQRAANAAAETDSTQPPPPPPPSSSSTTTSTTSTTKTYCANGFDNAARISIHHQKEEKLEDILTFTKLGAAKNCDCGICLFGDEGSNTNTADKPTISITLREIPLSATATTTTTTSNHGIPPPAQVVPDYIWNALKRSLLRGGVECEDVIIPVIVPGSTDSAQYRRNRVKAPVCLGFQPVKLDEGMLFSDLFHGDNERIPVDGLKWGFKVLLDVILDLGEDGGDRD